MRKNFLNEAIFWKYLADSLLEYENINKDSFYRKIEPLRSAWEVGGKIRTSEEIKKNSQNNTRFIKKNFFKILSEFKDQ